MIRQPIVTVAGHVDHGKTSLLDSIRHSVVTKGEAGGITQAIGVSIIPIETIRQVCGKLLDAMKTKITIPGLLAIDTPGHAAFTSLRKRGGSLADIAILVVDINEGFRPQTIESIEILKANKVPFVIAANKIDIISGWQSTPGKILLENVNALDVKTQGAFESKMYELVAQVQRYGLDAERIDRVTDYTKQVAIIPVSAKTGQGIPELLMVLTGLAQRYLEKSLTIEEHGPCKGTILEIKEEKGLGVTIDAIIYSGTLAVNDTLVIGGVDEPLVVRVRILLEPDELSEMRDRKSHFQNVKVVSAATGVKIVAPGIENAIAGMPLRGCSGKEEEIEQLRQDVQQELGEVISEDPEQVGVIIKADSLGALEALRHLLREKNIPISSASLGDVTKKDISKVEMMHAKDEFLGVLIGFNVHFPQDIEEYAKAKGIPIMMRDIIYEIMDDYDNYVKNLKSQIELKDLAALVRPCKVLILKGYVFRQNNPAVVGVEIEVGKIRAGDPIMNVEGKRLSYVKSMEKEQENVTIGEQGAQVAMAIDNVTVGRQIHEGDFLFTDISEGDFRKLKELKDHLSKTEIEVLREIAEIKRKDNPVWGMG